MVAHRLSHFAGRCPEAADPHAGGPVAASELRLTGAERQLQEEGERALRQPRGKLLLVLHLSQLTAPRAHHVRVARVLLQDAAQRHAGQVFVMRNHDLVLLCSEAGEDAGSAPYAPEGLPHRFGRLFEADAQDSHRLTSVWALDADPGALDRYLSGQSRSAPPVASGTTSRSQPVSLAGLQEILAQAPLEGLLVQQTGISLSPDRHRSFAARLLPAYQAVGLDLDRLGVPALVAEALGDPFLFRHFAETLDVRLLRLLEADLAMQGRALRPAILQRLPLLLELGLRAIVSPEFAAFARLADTAGLRLWVAVSLLQAGAELDLFTHARGLLRLTGARLVINQFDAAAFGLVRPVCLEADIVVLTWSPGLRAAVAGQGGLAQLFRPEAVLALAGIASEQALAWGQTAGFVYFQGLFLDQVQAATRMQRCHSASACTVRQCWTRAASLAMPGRAGCANPALLAAGFGAPD